MAGRRYGRPQPSRRRKTNWTSLFGDFSALGTVASGASAIMSSGGITEGSISAIGTIIRMRGCIHLELACETTATLLQQVAIGIALVDDKAFAAGVGSLPSPRDDEDFDGWMWWWCGHLGYGDRNDGTVTDSTGGFRRPSVEIELDSKAMRKWDENQTLVAIIQNISIDAGGAAVEFAMAGRMLMKAP